MPQGWRQYLEAGMHAGEITRSQAQRIVRQLVKEGQVAESRARAYVDELVNRSRKRTDDLRKLVRKEIRSQLSSLGLATKQDLARLERKLTKQPPARRSRGGTTTKRSSTSKRPPTAARS